MISIKNYVRAKSLEEAYELNQKKNNKIIGGMLWLKMGSGALNIAIDLCDLGLDKIEESDSEFIIGAMTSLRELEQHKGIDAYTNGAVRDALKDIVGVQFRNTATVGGSIWGRFGFSDVLTVMLAMDSYVKLYKKGVISLEKFSKMDYDNDILESIIIKKKPIKIAYEAVRIQSTDFPVLNCAVSCFGGNYKAVYGARPFKATVIYDDKKILSDKITQKEINEFSQLAVENVQTSGNMRGSGEYRSHLVNVLTQRCLLRLGGLE